MPASRGGGASSIRSTVRSATRSARSAQTGSPASSSPYVFTWALQPDAFTTTSSASSISAIRARAIAFAASGWP